jgi:hypothetical protein
MTLICLDSCQWSLTSLITGIKYKKNHKSRHCEKEKDKANKNVQKKMFEQKRFAGRHLLTFESQKLNYFGW